MSKPFKFLTLALAGVALSACALNPVGGRDQTPQVVEEGLPSVNRALAAEASGPRGVAVNRFLWTASLETLEFMPLFYADPVGGVILTEWFVNPEAPQERFKTSVYILDSRLRADGLRVRVFRQVRDPDMLELGWIDAAVNAQTAVEIENAILTRARELRLNAIDE